MNDRLVDVLEAALGGMVQKPANLDAALRFQSRQLRVRPSVSVKGLLKRLHKGANDAARLRFHHALAAWDYCPIEQDWTSHSPQNTAERRDRILTLLAMSAEDARVVDDLLPFFAPLPAVLVEDDLTKHTGWYKGAPHTGFYWIRFKKCLRDVRKMEPKPLNLLDQSTAEVLERLDCPWVPGGRRTRGLVVGYVQSGKTTHFTGVIARAIDEGYRLIIVLSGTMDLLRNQTQRRLDMELVGQQNILQTLGHEGQAHDYESDRDWPDRFLSLGLPPRQAGQPEIVRLTGAVDDFKSLARGIRALRFERTRRDLPLFDRDNLARNDVRLIVIKKNSVRLKKLIRDLEILPEADRREVPALVIDDESDQASVNTLASPRGDGPERTRINGRIVRLLKVLPKAQYLGYTATPFANVFINPNDPEDLYPRHFILSLHRPEGYMGVTDFHDLEPAASGRLSNEEAHVRGIPNDRDPADDRLLEAIDAFVLSGAIKLFRVKRLNGDDFRHHTMLIHESQRQADQWRKQEQAIRLWHSTGYDSEKGSRRLARLLEDFRQVWKDRGADLPFPTHMRELGPFLGRTIDRINSDDSPVLVVNGDPDADNPDFDLTPNVWKIIVGGAKLSRGYTVEGLTISYFRRRSKMQDTLMQMGRWFGFRKGYHDLVRLYIGRHETDGKNSLDLYEAFEALCRDEEAFRAQLERYRELGPEGSHLTPIQVPALVFNSHPQLRPTAKNKMFNAVLQWMSFAGQWREPVRHCLDTGPRQHNSRLVGEVLASSRVRMIVVEREGMRLATFVATVAASAMVRLLQDFQWPAGMEPLRAELAFLKRQSAGLVDRWTVLMPQVADGRRPRWKPGRDAFACVERGTINERFKAFTDPQHRQLAEWLVGMPDAPAFNTKPELRPDSRQGVMLLYPTHPKGAKETDRTPPVMGFALLLPPSDRPRPRCGFGVVVKNRPDSVTVTTAPLRPSRSRTRARS